MKMQLEQPEVRTVTTPGMTRVSNGVPPVDCFIFEIMSMLRTELPRSSLGVEA